MERTGVARTLIVGLGVLLMAQELCAQTPVPGRRTRHGGVYDPQTVETVTGEVKNVQTLRGRRGGTQSGVHLVLKTASEEIPVHLGPSWYLDQQQFTVAAGDPIEVRGSRVTVHGKPAIIAAAVKKGDQRLELRDDHGVPAWRGARHRRPK